MKTKMTNLLESPPYMPLNRDDREIWALLVGLGYHHAKIIKYTKGKEVVFAYKPFLKSKIKCFDEQSVIVDLRWAFQKTKDPLPLVRKVFADQKINLEGGYDKCICHEDPCVCWHNEK